MSNFEKLCKDYKENKILISQLEEENEKIKNEILFLMGENDTIISGPYKVTNRLICQNKFNQKEFKEAFPDLFQRYYKPASYLRFTIA